MGLPRSLKQFATFVNGNSYVGEMKEVTLPKLTRQMEKWRSGGMPGGIKLDFGSEEMQSELTAAGFMAEVLKTWGTMRHDGVLLRFAGSLQSDDAEGVDTLEVVMRGRFSEIDFGKAEAGKATEVKKKMEVSYYKLSINGEVIFELDPVNMIEIVGGVDRMAETRNALGL